MRAKAWVMLSASPKSGASPKSAGLGDEGGLCIRLPSSVLTAATCMMAIGPAVSKRGARGHARGTTDFKTVVVTHKGLTNTGPVSLTQAEGSVPARSWARSDAAGPAAAAAGGHEGGAGDPEARCSTCTAATLRAVPVPCRCCASPRADVRAR